MIIPRCGALVGTTKVVSKTHLPEFLNSTGVPSTSNTRWKVWLVYPSESVPHPSILLWCTHVDTCTQGVTSPPEVVMESSAVAPHTLSPTESVIQDKNKFCLHTCALYIQVNFPPSLESKEYRPHGGFSQVLRGVPLESTTEQRRGAYPGLLLVPSGTRLQLQA